MSANTITYEEFLFTRIMTDLDIIGFTGVPYDIEFDMGKRIYKMWRESGEDDATIPMYESMCRWIEANHQLIRKQMED